MKCVNYDICFNPSRGGWHQCEVFLDLHYCYMDQQKAVERKLCDDLNLDEDKSIQYFLDTFDFVSLYPHTIGELNEKRTNDTRINVV